MTETQPLEIALLKVGQDLVRLGNSILRFARSNKENKLNGVTKKSKKKRIAKTPENPFTLNEMTILEREIRKHGNNPEAINMALPSRTLKEIKDRLSIYEKAGKILTEFTNGKKLPKIYEKSQKVIKGKSPSSYSLAHTQEVHNETALKEALHDRDRTEESTINFYSGHNNKIDEDENQEDEDQEEDQEEDQDDDDQEDQEVNDSNSDMNIDRTKE